MRWIGVIDIINIIALLNRSLRTSLNWSIHLFIDGSNLVVHAFVKTHPTDENRFPYISGMEALETCINYWEDALAIYRSKEGGGPLAVLGPEEASFCRDLQYLLEVALELQERSEMLFLDERSVLFRPGSRDDGRSIDKEKHNRSIGGSRAAVGSRNGSNRNSAVIDNDVSGGESFASAQDQVRFDQN